MWMLPLYLHVNQKSDYDDDDDDFMRETVASPESYQYPIKTFQDKSSYLWPSTCRSNLPHVPYTYPKI